MQTQGIPPAQTHISFSCYSYIQKGNTESLLIPSGKPKLVPNAMIDLALTTI